MARYALVTFLVSCVKKTLSKYLSVFMNIIVYACCRDNLHPLPSSTADAATGRLVKTADSSDRKRRLSQDAKTAARDLSRLSSASESESEMTSSSSQSESTSPSRNTESTSANVVSSSTPHNVALHQSAPSPLKTASAVPTSAVLIPPPVTSSACPMFTSRPVAQTTALFRPEPRRHAQDTVRRRPSSLDNQDASPRTSSVSGTLSGDHDSRLSAWQRVQASMRPAHSEPMIAPLYASSPSSSLLHNPSPSRSALPPAPPSIIAPVAAAPPSSDLSKQPPTNSRLRQVIRDPSANPSPPVAVVQPSTSTVTTVTAHNPIDQRRRQRNQPTVVSDTVRIQSAAVPQQSSWIVPGWGNQKTNDHAGRPSQSRRSGGHGRNKIPTTISSSRQTGKIKLINFTIHQVCEIMAVTVTSHML